MFKIDTVKFKNKNTARMRQGMRSPLRQHYDAIIIGGGHNGLVCANYLALKNKKTLVLERRHVVGGAAVSEELWPGYTVSRASYLLSLFRSKVVEEIFPRTWEDEIKLYVRSPSSFTPTKERG